MISQQGHVFPVHISHAQLPHNFAVLLIGHPDAAAGAIEVHVLYPASAARVVPERYVALLQRLSMHLQACAEQHAAALAEDH